MSSVEFSETPVVASQVGETVIQEHGSGAIIRPPTRILPAHGPAVQVLEVGQRSLADAAKARAAAMAKRQGGSSKSAESAPVETAPAAVGETIDAGTGAAVVDESDDTELVTGATTKPAAVAKVEAPPAEHPELVELRGIASRQEKLLAETRAEIERLRTGESNDTKTRSEMLRSAEDGYLDDPVIAARKWVAAVIGSKSHDGADVDEELDNLIADLISARKSVPLDPAYRSDRTSALTKRAWQKSQERANNRERETEDQKAHRERAHKVQAVQELIGKDFESRRTEFPHLSMSQHLDGVTPTQAIWTAIERGVQLGTIDPNQADEVIWKQAAGIAEKYYRGRVEYLRKTLTPGTAAPSQPSAQQTSTPNAVVNEGKARQGHGPRAITNADASVAPATSAQTPAAPAAPRFISDDERRLAVIQKHFPKHPAAQRK